MFFVLALDVDGSMSADRSRQALVFSGFEVTICNFVLKVIGAETQRSLAENEIKSKTGAGSSAFGQRAMCWKLGLLSKRCSACAGRSVRTPSLSVRLRFGSNPVKDSYGRVDSGAQLLGAIADFGVPLQTKVQPQGDTRRYRTR